MIIERANLLAATEKSDDFARTFVSSGTFGFLPGVPSAYTQPLYGWFLAALYRTWGDTWLVIGVAQTLVAVETALIVMFIGRRFISPGTGLIAGVLSTLHPYVAWHDLHVNREILDELVGAAVFFLALLLLEKRNWWVGAALGVALGLAILGNARLTFLPLAIAAFLVWRHVRLQVVAAALVACCLVVLPWVIRNRLNVGCYAITTDGPRALWKANNPYTYDALTSGGWIDDVPDPPGAPPSPEQAFEAYQRTGRYTAVDECGQMHLYTDLTVEFWRRHPKEKIRLVGQAVVMMWNPSPVETDNTNRPRIGTYAETGFALALFVLAAIGTTVVARPVLVLSVIFVLYETLGAMIFAGATRYRVPWDFVLALLAAAAIDRLVRRAAVRRLGSNEAVH